MREGVIRVGSKNRKAVIEIQKIVGATPDGVFGPKTEKLVAIWQADQGLAADGVVGPKTMEAMGLLDTDEQAADFKPPKAPASLYIDYP